MQRRDLLGLFGGTALAAILPKPTEAQMLLLGVGKPGGSSVTPAPFANVNGPADGPVANGWYESWSATYAGTHTVSAAEPFTVRRPGFDATGAAVTYDDTVYVTRMVRVPCIAGATSAPTNTLTTAALSDPVLSGDTIFGGAANNSTVAYPKPIANWIDTPKQLIDGTGIDIEVYATHFFARNGRGVACVKVTGTPQTSGSPVTKTHTYQLSSRYGASVPCYSARWTSADFAAGIDQDIKFEFEVFPWCGSSSTTTTGTYPNALVSNTPIFHRTVGPTIKYAYVDGVGGSPAVQTTLAAAKATPYATATAALTGMFAASSDASFCHIVFKAGVAHTWDNTAPTGATRLAKNGWLVFEGDPSDPDPYTNVTVTTSGTNKITFTTPGGSLLNYMCWRNLTLTIAAASNLGNLGGITGLWLDHVNFVSAIATWAGGSGYGFATQCAGSGAGNTFTLSSTNLRFQLLRACTSAQNMAANVLVSCTVTGASGAFQSGNATNLASENLLVLNCKQFDATTTAGMVGWPNAAAGPPAQVRNNACVNTILSNANVSNPGPSFSFSEHLTLFMQNVVYFNLTMGNSGASSDLDACRINFLNDPPGTTPTAAGTTFGTATDQGSWRLQAVRNCNFARASYKHDVFTSTDTGAFPTTGNTGCANVIGGWSTLNGCGVRNIQSEATTATFRADLATSGNENGYMGLNSIAAVAIVYTARSTNNWQPVSGYRTVPLLDMVDSWDAYGTAFRTDGTEAAGAVAR